MVKFKTQFKVKDLDDRKEQTELDDVVPHGCDTYGIARAAFGVSEICVCCSCPDLFFDPLKRIFSHRLERSLHVVLVH